MVLFVHFVDHKGDPPQPVLEFVPMLDAVHHGQVLLELLVLSECALAPLQDLVDALDVVLAESVQPLLRERGPEDLHDLPRRQQPGVEQLRHQNGDIDEPIRVISALQRAEDVEAVPPEQLLEVHPFELVQLVHPPQPVRSEPLCALQRHKEVHDASAERAVLCPEEGRLVVGGVDDDAFNEQLDGLAVCALRIHQLLELGADCIGVTVHYQFQHRADLRLNLGIIRLTVLSFVCPLCGRHVLLILRVLVIPWSAHCIRGILNVLGRLEVHLDSVCGVDALCRMRVHFAFEVALGLAIRLHDGRELIAALLGRSGRGLSGDAIQGLGARNIARSERVRPGTQPLEVVQQ